MKWGQDLIAHSSKRHSNSFQTKTETTPLNCHPWLPPKQREVGFSFPHGYPGNEARKLDSRRQPLSAPYDMPQIPLKESFREARNMPDYFCRLYFSFSLQSEISPFLRKAIIFHSSYKNSVCNCLSSAWCNFLKWGETCVPWSQVLLCNIWMAKLPFCGSKHNMWSNYEATITQARPDVIDRPSDRRVRGQMPGVKVQLLSNSVCICVCMRCFVFFLWRKGMLIHN